MRTASERFLRFAVPQAVSFLSAFCQLLFALQPFFDPFLVPCLNF